MTPSRVLIIQTAYLGDTVFTSALVQSLRGRWPEAEIDLCVAPRARDVALAIPGCTSVQVFDKRGADSGLSGLRRMAKRLAARRFDLAVLPHRSWRTAALARLCGIPQRVGFAEAAASFIYTARVRTSETSFLGREGDLARHFGAQPSPMRLVARPEWVDSARRALGEGRWAGICLGSEWQTKIWPAVHVTDLARQMQASGLRIVLLGGARERAMAREVGAIGGCIDTTGNSVGEALGILSLCSLAVGGDTGLVHAARALGVPTVAVFGPTTPAVHQFGERERPVWLALSCSPCSAHGSRRCPLGHHACMRDLDAGRVAAACREVLAA